MVFCVRSKIPKKGRSRLLVPNENPVHPAADVIPQGATAKFKPFKQFADLLECSKGNSQMHPCKIKGAYLGDRCQSRAKAVRSTVAWRLFRRPVVRSGGAVRRPGKPPRLVPLPAAESVVAQVSPSPTRDAFSIGDSKRNTKQEYGVVTLRRTRSQDRGTHAEWNQSPAPRRLAAKASAVWTALHRCPGLAPVLGSQGRK